MMEDFTMADIGAFLLATGDIKLKNDYDKDFYNELSRIKPPALESLDDRIRRAIIKYVETLWHDFKGIATEDLHSDELLLAAMTESVLRGYELGRKLKRPIAGK